MDNKVFTAINKIVDTAWLGILWTIISLGAPIAGIISQVNAIYFATLVIGACLIGPASCALYYSIVKVIRRSRSYATKEFFRGLKTNFITAAPVSLIYSVFAYLMYVDFQYSNSLLDAGDSLGNVLMVVFLCGSIFVAVSLIWAFPMLSRFTVKILGVFKNSLILGTKHLIRSLLLAAIWAALGILIVAFVPLQFYIFLPAIVPGTAALLRSFVLEPVFKKYTAESAGPPEETGIDEWYRE